MRKKLPILVLAAAVATAVPLSAQGRGKGRSQARPAAPPANSARDDAPGHGALAPGRGGTPPGLAKRGFTPPGLAKQGGMPPGLAKKFGRPAPQRVYVAFDPRRDDRAWFLIENRWVERRGFDPALRLEVRQSLRLPAIPLPPVPPPVERLHVVLFGS